MPCFICSSAIIDHCSLNLAHIIVVNSDNFFVANTFTKKSTRKDRIKMYGMVFLTGKILSSFLQVPISFNSKLFLTFLLREGKEPAK